MRGNFFYHRLAKRLINERRKKKFSQEQLALLSEIDRTYIARIEEAKANPTIKVLNKISKTLHIRLWRLFKGV